MDSYTRLFFAIPTHPLMKKALAISQEKIEEMSVEGIRWINPEHLHITLFYLGTITRPQFDILIGRIPTIIDYVNTFNLKFTNLSWFPDSAKPHTLIAGVELNLALLELVNSLQVCVDASGINVKSLPYIPHLSIGKILPNHSPSYFAPQSLGLTNLLPVEKFVLMQTKADVHGQNYYHTLAEFNLKAYADHI